MDDQNSQSNPLPANPSAQISPAQPVAQRPPKSFLTNKLFLLITAILFFLILGLVGYQILGIGRDQCDVLLCLRLGKETENLNQTTPTSAPSPTPDPTADWKTYTNSKGKYSLQYPPTIAFIKDASGNAAGNLSNNKAVIATEPTVLSLSNYIDQKTWCLSISSTTRKAFNLNSQNSLRYDKTPCGITGSTDIYSVHNGIAYHIFIETQQNFDSVSPIFDQILSTFKFTQ